jgi:hypothetical protein
MEWKGIESSIYPSNAIDENPLIHSSVCRVERPTSNPIQTTETKIHLSKIPAGRPAAAQHSTAGG